MTGQVIPPDFKKSWNPSTVLQNPAWDFQSNSWKEDIENPLFLEEKKESKTKELSEKCQNVILSGFDFVLLGINYHFSYDLEAQMNFQDTYNLFQNNLLDEVNWTARLNGEKKRIKLNKSSFTLVYTSAIKHKNEYLNHLYEVVLPRLEAAQTKAEVDAVIWGRKENELNFNMNEMLDKKINEIALIEKETTAQKGHNSYMETTLMEVADILLSSM